MTAPDPHASTSEYARRTFVAGLVAFTAAACGRAGTSTATGRATTSTTPGLPSSTSSTTTTTAPTTSTDPPASTEPRPSTAPDPETPPSGPAGLVCRAAWGAQPARDGGRTHTISRLTVHHSAVRLADGDDPTRHLRQYQATHQGPNGWVDIAYHVAVDRAGTAYECRSLALAGDTATNYDPAGHFLILAIGNFDEQAPTEAQLDGIARLLRWGADNFGAPLSSVTGHRDHAATACPGGALYNRLTELRRRAEALPVGASGVAGC